MSMLVGCQKSEEETKVILTTGFTKNEIFKIEEINCTLPEIMVYITNIQNQYEKVYGPEIWGKKVDGLSLEENVKNIALSKMSEIKTVVLLARRSGVELDENDMAKVDEATDKYYGSLNRKEINAMGINKATIHSLYEEYALAQKMYEYVIKDINPEISDDEARTITVEHILIKTYTVDSAGKMVNYSNEDMGKARKLATDIELRAREGEDFEELAEEYSEDERITLSFGKGEMEAPFENAAFDLGTDEISSVVQTKYGFHIIKCISTFNKEVTDENKIRIVEERKQQAFSEEYDAFASTLVKNLNDELWDSVKFIHDEEVTTSDFFECYESLE